MEKAKIWKFIKFCFVGGTSALIGLISFNVFFLLGVKFIGCVLLSMVISIIYNFSMNRNVTFKAKKTPVKKQILKYGLVYSISQSASLFTSIFVRSLLGEGILEANIAVISGIAISIPIGFFGSLLWAFKNKPKPLNS